MKNSHWSSIKIKIQNLPEDKVIFLIKDLYSLNKGCQNFLESKFCEGSGIEEYRKIIMRFMYPDIMSSEDISLVKAKKAISDYSKASKNLQGTLELMMFYVEMGHKYTSDYGDMYAQFYNSLISMFNRIIQKISKEQHLIPLFFKRLERIAKESQNFGWGYDEVNEIFEEFKISRTTYEKK